MDHAKTVRRASESEFWTAIQRLLSFEEPFGRWKRLRKQIAKVASRDILGDPAIALNASEEIFFEAIYGTDEQINNSYNQLFSLVLASEELAKFKERAFDFCLDPTIRVGSENNVRLSKDLEIYEPLAEICMQEKYSFSQKSYLNHCLRLCPDWSRLLKEGPWQDDSRAMLVSNVLAASGFASESDRIPDRKAPLADAELISVNSFRDMQKIFHREVERLRTGLPATFLPKRIVLVEGATEQILLPHFARCIASDFDSRAILFLPAGGANQVARRYLSMRHIVSVPIDCVLDGDVLSQANFLRGQVRDSDRLFVLNFGAIEEAYTQDQIAELANVYFGYLGGEAIYGNVEKEDMSEQTNQQFLHRLWRERDQGTFDKTGFAKVASEVIVSSNEIPPQLRELVANLIGGPPVQFAS